MVRRNQRLLWEEKNRRGDDRRRLSRRKSDKLKIFLKYLAVVVLTAALLSIIH